MQHQTMICQALFVVTIAFVLQVLVMFFCFASDKSASLKIDANPEIKRFWVFLKMWICLFASCFLRVSVQLSMICKHRNGKQTKLLCDKFWNSLTCKEEINKILGVQTSFFHAFHKHRCNNAMRRRTRFPSWRDN